tara:strand:+ start:2272 stop:2961 length:690 start_codon:yes stop_codon:yes gene_type:complete
MKNYIQQKQKKILESQTNFYTPSGINVYIRDPVEGVNVKSVILKLEEILPNHYFHEIEMIIIGWFEEFEKRNINAFYDSGALYISNMQFDETEMIEKIIHEIAHSLETTYGYEIYGDQKVQDEFARKRKHLHDILWKDGYKIPLSFFMDTEFNQEFDDLLYKKIGYNKLNQYAAGLFINSYAVTSLREYFATAIADFYMNTNHNFLKKLSPAVYKKIILLQNTEVLDKP